MTIKNAMLLILVSPRQRDTDTVNFVAHNVSGDKYGQ